MFHDWSHNLQLALLNWSMYKKIQYHEFLVPSWTESEELRPNVTALIKFYTQRVIIHVLKFQVRILCMLANLPKQKIPSEFEKIPAIFNYFHNREGTLTEKQLLDASYEAEPEYTNATSLGRV